MMYSLKSIGMVILGGNSCPELVNSICQQLNVNIGKCSVYYRSSGETQVDIGETVRGRDVYILQSVSSCVNNDIMELLTLAYACKSSCARKIVAVIPYLPYSRQSKRRKRGPIICKLIAKMFCSSGIKHLITVDLHSKEIQGFFDVPVDNLRASPFLIKYIESLEDYRNAVIVARNPSGVNRATSYAERLRLPLVVIHGEEREEIDTADGRNSPPPDNPPTEKSLYCRLSGIELLPLMVPKAKPPLTLVGDVSGRIAFIVDGIIDDVSQYIRAADFLRDHGAQKIYAIATHGLLSSDAPVLLEESIIDEIVVTNSVPHDAQKLTCHKIRTVDISVLLVEAIRRIHNNESMSYLFMNVSQDD